MAFLLAVARVIEPMVELGVELIETGVWATSFAGFKMGLDAMEGPMGDGDYWPKRSATATHSPTIYQVHNIGNLTIADMKVLNGMVAESQHHGDNTAIFRNEKMNWTAVGTMTGTQVSPDFLCPVRGYLHSHMFSFSLNVSSSPPMLTRLLNRKSRHMVKCTAASMSR